MADQSVNKVKDFIRTHAEFFDINPAEKIEVETMEKSVEVANRQRLGIFDIGWNGLNHASVWLPEFACSGLSLKDALKKAADVTLDESNVLISGARYQWRFMPVTSNRLVILDTIIKNQQQKHLGDRSLSSKDEELVAVNAKIQELEREIEQLRAKMPDQHAHSDHICDYIKNLINEKRPGFLQKYANTDDVIKSYEPEILSVLDDIANCVIEYVEKRS